MLITLLIGDHEDAAPGELIEVLDAVDEGTQDCNPDYWKDAVAKHTGIGGYHRLTQVTVDVPTAELVQALYPEPAAIPATVVGDNT